MATSTGHSVRDWIIVRSLFSPRMVLLIVSFLLITGVALGAFFSQLQVARKQKAAVAALEQMQGVAVLYDYQLDAKDELIEGAQPPAPAWLCNLLGKDFFANVTWVGVMNTRSGDQDLSRMGPALQDLPDLIGVSIYDTKITAEATEQLQQLLPGKKVKRHDPPRTQPVC